MVAATTAAKTHLAVVRLASRGRVQEFLHAFGFAPDLLDDPGGRLPQDVGLSLWEKVGRSLGTPNLGLQAARAVPLGAFGVPEYVLRSSATLGDGLRELIRLRRLFHDTHQLSLEVDGDVARLVHGLEGAPLARQPTELLLGRIVVLTELVTGAKLPVREVRFGHEAPADTGDHRRLFGTSPRFGRGVSELCFDAAALKLRIPNADPELAALLRAHADQLLAQLPVPSDDFLSRVRFRVAAGFTRGVPTASAVARELRTSTRSLQRRLQQEGTSFQDVVDAVRRDLALRGVSDDRVPLGALALDLGFADASAFYRAFRRWTGVPPGEYRRQGMRQAS